MTRGHFAILVPLTVVILSITSCGPTYLVLQDGRAVECDKVTYSEFDNGYICHSDGEIFFVSESDTRQNDPLVKKSDDLKILKGVPGKIRDEDLLQSIEAILESFLAENRNLTESAVVWRLDKSSESATKAQIRRLTDRINEIFMKLGFNVAGDNIKQILSEKLLPAGDTCSDGWKNTDSALFFNVKLIFCMNPDPNSETISISVWSSSDNREIFSGSVHAGGANQENSVGSTG
jgi:hypothetical protein